MLDLDKYVNQIINADCLELMQEIPDKSIDCIICDLPYGTTACSWDSIIPFDKLWKQYERIIKDNSAIILFANEPFTSLLVCSKIDWFKYRIDWDKKIPSGLGYAKYRPMSQIEDICVFCRDKEKTIYNPQMTQRITPIKSGEIQGKQEFIVVLSVWVLEKNIKRLMMKNILQH